MFPEAIPREGSPGWDHLGTAVGPTEATSLPPRAHLWFLRLLPGESKIVLRVWKQVSFPNSFLR